VSANQVCFERELLDHYRLVFEKPATVADSARPRSRVRTATDQPSRSATGR
jgi:hypothetical protein